MAINGVNGIGQTTELENLQATGTTSTTRDNGITVLPDEDTTEATGVAALQEELKILQRNREINMRTMDQLETKIAELVEEIEDEILNAEEMQEDAIKEHEENSKRVLAEELAAYVEANKDKPGSMTNAQLRGNIDSALKNIAPNVAKIMNTLLAASSKMGELDANLKNLNGLIVETNDIDADIASKNDEIKAAQEAAAKKSCDPIGFVMKDANGEQVQYDFIKDDGNFDSTSDFLGADNQWAEMQALDTDGDGVVTSDEMKEGNIKAVKTNADGSQEVVDVSEISDDLSINLNSYTEGGAHDAIDTVTDTDGDGTVDQELLGTFSVNVDGQDIQGYNTLDDVDFLADKYNLDAANPFGNLADDLQPHADFHGEQTTKAEELQGKIDEQYTNIGLTEEAIASINVSSKAEGEITAQSELDKIKAEKETEVLAEEAAAEEAQEADEADEADAIGNEVLADDISDDEVNAWIEGNNHGDKFGDTATFKNTLAEIINSALMDLAEDEGINIDESNLSEAAKVLLEHLQTNVQWLGGEEGDALTSKHIKEFIEKNFTV